MQTGRFGLRGEESFVGFRIVFSAMMMCLALSGAAFAQSSPLTTTDAMIPSR
jgi:hypothetical protein